MTIRYDATRLQIITKDTRHRRAVVARQGQVLLDTDFDQQSRLQLERVEIETADTFGAAGRLVVPEGGPRGFKITASPAPNTTPADFNIAIGRGYLGGWLLENASICTLTTQPHPRSGDAVTVPSIIGLKALIRHIDPVEDPVLADPALGDAQASGRTLIDWQVFPFVVSGGGSVTCATAASNVDWKNLILPSTGSLTTIVQTTAPPNDPCSLMPGGGYTRLENLLYRIEVHGGDAATNFPTVDGPRFNLNNLKLKLSRRNASTMVRVTAVTGTTITVTPPMLDAHNWFAPGLFAEIVSIHDDVDPRAALAHERLFRVAMATDDQVTLEGAATDIAATGVASDGSWFLRLWDAFTDGSGFAIVSASGAQSAVIDLGDGITIQLGTGTFRRGDYWTWAARADGTIDWPSVGGVAQPMTPQGPVIAYAPIAALGGSSTAPAFEDCCIPSATLTDRALLYRGGDDQSVFAPTGSAMVKLPSKLRVAVMRGEVPVVGASVQWTLVAGAPPCQINGSACDGPNTVTVQTGADGLAAVDWSIDSKQPLAVHGVQASIAPGLAGGGPPPVVFSATFETAAHTGYTPGKCAHLTKVDNVQDALDTLCAEIGAPRSLALTSITLLDTKGTKTELIVADANLKQNVILNAQQVPSASISGGIAFGFDGGKPSISIQPFDPVVEIELDLPYPITDPDRLYWAQASSIAGAVVPTVDGPFGFQRVRLDGTIATVDKGAVIKDGGLTWTPSSEVVNLFGSVVAHQWGARINSANADALKAAKWQGKPADRIACRIRLRSAMIWVDDPTTKARLYLNAAHLGTSGATTKRELLVSERDPRRAADLDFFIYLGVTLPQ